MAVTALLISIITLAWTIGWALWVWKREQPSVTVGFRQSARVTVNRGANTTLHIDVINRGGLDEEILDVGFRSHDPAAGINIRLSTLMTNDYTSTAGGPQLPCRIQSRSSRTWDIDGAALAQFAGTSLIAYAVRREPASDKHPTGELHWTSTTALTV